MEEARFSRGLSLNPILVPSSPPAQINYCTAPELMTNILIQLKNEKDYYLLFYEIVSINRGIPEGKKSKQFLHGQKDLIVSYTQIIKKNTLYS